jgi:hypothetical protein
MNEYSAQKQGFAFQLVRGGLYDLLIGGLSNFVHVTVTFFKFHLAKHFIAVTFLP